MQGRSAQVLTVLQRPLDITSLLADRVEAPVKGGHKEQHLWGGVCAASETLGVGKQHVTHKNPPEGLLVARPAGQATGCRGRPSAPAVTGVRLILTRDWQLWSTDPVPGECDWNCSRTHSKSRLWQT